MVREGGQAPRKVAAWALKALLVAARLDVQQQAVAAQARRLRRGRRRQWRQLSAKAARQLPKQWCDQSASRLGVIFARRG